MRAFRRSLAACSARPGFRVVHYSIQRNHLHFLVEAEGRVALGSGMKSLSARVGRCVNRVFERRGKVLDGRYHHRLLRTPREVRHALAYVLLNSRHHYYERHGRRPPEARLDPASSSIWFDGWKRLVNGQQDRAGPGDAGGTLPEVARANTWLLRKGWRKHRLIDPDEVPGIGRRR